MPGGPFLILIPFLMILHVINPDLARTVSEKCIELIQNFSDWYAVNGEEITEFINSIFNK